MQLSFKTNSQNILIICLSLLLSSCSIADKSFDMLGFKVKNYFYNDNNEYNRKFEKKFSKDIRRTPSGNTQYIAESKNVSTSSPVKQNNSSNNAANNFWAPYYSKDAAKTPTHQAVKIEKVNIHQHADHKSLPPTHKQVDHIDAAKQINSTNPKIAVTSTATPVVIGSVTPTPAPISTNPKIEAKIHPNSMLDRESKIIPSKTPLSKSHTHTQHPHHQTKVKSPNKSKSLPQNIDDLGDDEIEILNEVKFIPTNNSGASTTNYRYHVSDKPAVKK